MNNYRDVNSVLLFLDEIEKDLDSHRYLSALHLALSIPDILGKIEYPELKKEHPYEEWFNNYMFNALFGLLYSDNRYSSPEFKLDGKKCYSLRCKLFHEGKNELDFDEFVLSFDDEGMVRGNYAGLNILYNPDDSIASKEQYLYVSCKELCKDIVFSAKKYIEQNPDKKYPTLRINNGGGKIDSHWFIR